MFEFTQNLALAGGQVDRSFHREFDQHVAGAAATQGGHPLGPQAHLFASLGADGHFDAGLAAVDGGHLDLATQGGGGDADGDAAEQVHAVALEDRVILDLDKDVQIARGAATHASLTLTSQTDAGAGFDASRDVDRQRAFLFNPTGAPAGFAGVFDDLALTIAGRTGAFDGEEALLRANLAHAGTGRAGDGFGRPLGPGAATDFAGDRRGDVDGFLDALERFLKADAQVIAQVGPALGTVAAVATATATPHEIAKQILEHIREC